jgi:DNA polymerase-3 subunit alpha
MTNYFQEHKNNKNLVITNEETLAKQKKAVYEILEKGGDIYTFFDIETTGTEITPKKDQHGNLKPRDRIIEVAFIFCVINDSGQLETLIVDGEPVIFQEYINPFAEDKKILKNFNSVNDNDPEALMVHGITKDFLEGKGELFGKKLSSPAPTFNQIRPYMDDILCANELIDLKGNVYALGHNAVEFDAVFISEEMQRDDAVFNDDIVVPRAFESSINVKDSMVMMKSLYTRNDLQKYKEGFNVVDHRGKKKEPGFSLDYLVHMMNVKSNARDEFHGGLLDSQLLLDAFNELIKTPKYQNSHNKIPIQKKTVSFLEDKIKSNNVILNLSESLKSDVTENIEPLTLIQTDASLQEGTGLVKEYIDVAKEYGLKNLAMIDVVSLLNFIPFYQACKKEGINPIAGVTLKVENKIDVYNYLNKNKKLKPELIGALDKTLRLLTEDSDGFIDSVEKNNFYKVFILDELIEKIDIFKQRELNPKTSKDALKKSKNEIKTKMISFAKEFNIKTGIKTIRNVSDEDVDLVISDISDISQRLGYDRAKDHSDLTILAENEKGYENVRKIITDTSYHGQYWLGNDKTREKGEYSLFKMSYLEGKTDGIKVLVGDFNDLIGRTLKSEGKDLAGKLLDELTQLVGKENVYGDLNFKMFQEKPSFIELEKKLNQNMVSFLEEKDIQIIATQHASFAKVDDYRTHLNKTAILLEHKVDGLDIKPNRYGFQFVNSNETTNSIFKENKKALENAQKLSLSLKVEQELDNPKLPDFDTKEGYTQADQLIENANKGLEKRFAITFDRIWEKQSLQESKNKSLSIVLKSIKDSLKFEKGNPKEDEERLKFKKLWIDFKDSMDKEKCRELVKTAYQRRLDYELDVINQMGFAGYFLIKEDMVSFCHKEGIPVGAGRGSAAGSLVVYCLNVTNIDPLEYGLIFERFLNPERKEMPDIDTDILGQERDKVLRYLMEKYSKFGNGYEGASYIITKGTFAARSTLKYIGKINNKSVAWQERLSSLIPKGLDANGKDYTIKSQLEDNEYLKYRYDNESVTRELIDQALRLEEGGGRAKSFGKHAGGIVVGNLINSCPIVYEKGIPVIQFDKKYCETAGLVKFDLLGLSTLGHVDMAIKLIAETEEGSKALKEFGIEIIGNSVDFSNLKLDDKSTYDMISEGKVALTFQIGGNLFSGLLKKINVQDLNGIADLVSIGRPGPLQSGMDNIYSEGLSDPSSIKYDHEKMEDILSTTFGAILYQEQVMRSAVDLAGYTKGGADKLRKAMGKKILEAMEEERIKFVEGSKINSNIDKKLAEEIFDKMEKFAGYGFNKSHAVAYGLLTYITGLLKNHFPVQYSSALLTFESTIGNKASEKLPLIIDDTRSRGIKFKCPDINKSGIEFKPLLSKNSILFGLAGIKGATFDKFIEDRDKNGDYKNLEDLMIRMGSSKKIITLINTGACDLLPLSRDTSELKGFDKYESRTNKLNLKRLLLREEYDVLESLLSSLDKRKKYKKGQEEDLPIVSVDYQSVVNDGANHPEKNLKVMLDEEHDNLFSYVSSHPLDIGNIRNKLKLDHITPRLKSISEVDNIKDKENGDELRIAGIVSDSEMNKVSNAGKQYGMFKLNDGVNQRMFFLFESQIHSIRDILKDKLGRAFKDGDIISAVGKYYYKMDKNTGREELEFGIKKIEFPRENIVVDFELEENKKKYRNGM